MRSEIIFLVLLAFFTQHLTAQENELTIYDCEVGRLTYLQPENKKNLIWRSNKGYTYQTDEQLLYSEINTDENNVLLDIQDVNDLHAEHQIKKLQRFPAIHWPHEDVIRYVHDDHVLWYNIKSNLFEELRKLPSSAENLDFSPLNKLIAYTIKNDLFINVPHKGSVTVAASDDPNIVFGKTVHRNEFGISKGTYWSPNGNYLAFYRNDQSNVTDYPLVNLVNRPATLNNIKYPMAGMDSEQVTIGVYHLETGTITYLRTGEPKDQYLTNLKWSPDEKYIYVAVLNRDQNHMKLNRYDVEMGALDKTLFEEKHEKYVEPLNPIIFRNSDGDQFLWQSERDGHNHFYLYDTEGKLIKQVTKGPWDVIDYLGQDAKGKKVFFTSTKSSPLDECIYSVDPDNQKIEKVSMGSGIHRASLNPEGNYLIDAFSSPTVPRKINILNRKGKVIKRVLEADNPLKEYMLGKTKFSNIKAADGKTDLFYRMVYPADFDSTQLYPVIVYVYNGPHVQLVENRWAGRTELWQHYMAQKGFISFTLDGRGSADRGLAFENVTFRQLGIIEMEDQIKGVEYLKSLPYVDEDRIGIYGWSYGGYMVTSLMVNYPDVFKAGVAGGPVIDWRYYEVMYTERYMDTPQKNPAGYDKTSLLDQASNLKGKLLIIHGAQDPVVVWQHSLDFITKCIENRKQLDYFVYPTHEHNVQGIDRIHLTEKVSNYFFDQL